jgi:hypothetical protein
VENKMEILNNKLDGLNLKGINIASKVVDKTEVGLFTVEQRHLTDAYFDTSKGYIKVDPVISLICVINDEGKKIEMAAGIKMVESMQMVEYLIQKDFSFKELPEEVRKIRNYRAIIRIIENKLRFEDRCIAKGIDPKALEETAATSEKEQVPLNPAEKKTFPAMKTISEIPVYRKKKLSAKNRSMLNDIIKLRNLANSLIKELTTTNNK